MKKFIALLLFGIFIFGLCTINSVEAARKGGKTKAPQGLPAEEITAMAESVNKLVEKTYSGSLFSPEENAEIIRTKMKMDAQMLVYPDPQFAPLYYKLGTLLTSRGYKNDAIDCFQTLLENFADTALAPKAKDKLRALGVNVKEDIPEEESTETEEGM